MVEDTSREDEMADTFDLLQSVNLLTSTSACVVPLAALIVHVGVLVCTCGGLSVVRFCLLFVYGPFVVMPNDPAHTGLI